MARGRKAAGSCVSAEKLVAEPVGRLEELLRWRVDPQLPLFRRVCGRVVRGDGGGPGTNWKTDYDYLYVTPSIGVAVIDS